MSNEIDTVSPEFTETTKRKCAQRVNYLCSNPSCGRGTSGPNEDSDKSTTTGEAAHISAKSPGGPRYDKQQTNEQRRHIDNALWLCGSCHKLVDTDWKHYTKEQLLDFKKQAEEFARNMQKGSYSQSLKSSQKMIQIFDRHEYAKREYERIKSSSDRFTMLLADHKLIETHVDFKSYNGETETINIHNVVDRSNLCYLLGESGTGKTQSLWELYSKSCKSLAEDEVGPCPVFVPTKSWKEDNSFFDIICDVLDAEKESINNDLKTGSFLFFVDGINEVDHSHSSNCYNDLAKFISKYINNKFVISCRSPDFRENIIPLGSYIKKGKIRDVFEISRLSKSQIREYTNNFFDNKNDAFEFLRDLGLDDDIIWSNDNSSIHLARIPLFLQIYLETYKTSKELPDSKAKLVSALVRIIINREESQAPFGFGITLLENTLSSFSYALAKDGYNLRFPSRIAKTIIAPILNKYIKYYSEHSKVSLDIFWKKTISANFLSVYSETEVEWLHQLLRDYFLGLEIADIWANQDYGDDIKISTIRLGWDMALSIALETLKGTYIGSEMLWKILDHYRNKFGDQAIIIFSGQSTDSKYQLTLTLIKSIVADGDYETCRLNILVEHLPFIEVVNALDEAYSCKLNEVMLVKIIEALSHMMIFHQPSTEIEQPIVGFYGKEIKSIYSKSAIKRCREVLYRYLRSSDEFTCFYAAKGLFEIDRPASVDCFRKLLSGKNDSVKKHVLELVEEWGIQ